MQVKNLTVTYLNATPSGVLSTCLEARHLGASGSGQCHFQCLPEIMYIYINILIIGNDCTVLGMARVMASLMSTFSTKTHTLNSLCFTGQVRRN